MPADHPLLLSPNEAARLLSISRSTLYVLMERDEIPSVKVGGSRRIRRSALEAYVEGLGE